MDPLAAYGAVAATLALGWQVYTWRHSRRTVVEVQVTMGFLAFGPRAEEAVILTAINHSEHEIRVTSTGILAQDGSGRVLTAIAQPPSAGLPGPIPPRDSRQTWYAPGDLAGSDIDVFRPVVGQVTLADNKSFRSKGRPLMKR